jgi:CRP/FNR family transcriptional regulator, polysaccharide utilization system transcription regulator
MNGNGLNHHMEQNRNCLFCQSKADVFSCLCSEELDLIDKRRIEVHFRSGELIFKQGTPNLHFLCLTKGKVKTYIEGFDDKNLILQIIKPVEYILGPGIYADQMHHFSAMAIEDSVACLVDLETFKHLIRTNPDFAEDFLRKISLNSIFTYDSFLSLTQKQMPGRLADVLLYLEEKIYESTTFHCSLSRQDLADMSGMSKESAIRILRDFKDMGLITVDGNDFEILNTEQLRHISQTG